MGGRNSKSKHSYDVASVGLDPQPNVASSEKVVRVDESSSKVESIAASIATDSKLVPEWINETQFVDILKTNISEFSQIKSFRVKPAMAPGENYATLMLRVSIDVELNDKTIKPVSYMFKVPHDSPAMQQMLLVANFFTTENYAYIEVLPKLEALYKAKGLDITFAPRAYKFSASEPKLANTVLMEDLGQVGYKNLNRLECLNVEQTKFVLRKMAQYHAAGAHYVTVHGSYPELLLYGMFGKDNAVATAMIEGMMQSSQKMFLANLKNYKHGEQYRDKLEACFRKTTTEFLLLIEPNTSEFNVLNHGDSWINNLLFKANAQGQLTEMVFVDFQNPKYGSPAQDLLYFIMTSVHIEHKLKDFEYFISYYYDNLVEHLQFLEYPGRVLSLRELHQQIYKYGTWAMMGSMMVLPAVLLDPNELASFENFLGESETAQQFKNLMYSNKRYCAYIEKILPWLDHRGFLSPYESPESAITDIATVSPTATNARVDPIVNPTVISEAASVDTNEIIPWLDFNDFADIIAGEEPEFQQILNGTVSSATKPGDNYASKILKIDINVQLKDNSEKTYAYIIKVVPPNMHTDFAFLFPKENEVYEKYVDAFAQLYRDVGLPLSFGPKSYKFSRQIDAGYQLLENLQPRGFKMANRLEGLDLDHSKCVLKKLAQWHAASLRFQELNGAYAPVCNYSSYNKDTRDIYVTIVNKFKTIFFESVSKFNGIEEYFDKLETIYDTFTDKLIADNEVDEQEFNVLNHGDAWMNNMLFQYDEAGHVQDIYLIDYQESKYGNPAQDLYYFIMTSTQLDIKTDQFDYLIRWYHEHLVEHSKILKYSGFVPSLKELHIILLKR